MLPRSLPAARAYGQGAPLDFTVAGDQEERDTFNCVLADFKAYLLIPQVRFYSKPLISSGFPQLPGNICPAGR